jgi:hypothetical protein
MKAEMYSKHSTFAPNSQSWPLQRDTGNIIHIILEDDDAAAAVIVIKI